MSGKAWLQLAAYTVITIGFIVGLILYQHRGSQISHVSGRVTKIEHGNPCLEQGPHSALCQKSRNLFARTVTFTQACEIVKRADPAFNCAEPKGGGSQSSPNTGNQLPGGLRAPRQVPRVHPAQAVLRVP